MALSKAQGFIGAGDLYLALYGVGDVLGPWIDTGNTTQFSIKSNADIKEQISKKRDTYGQPLETVALQRPADLSIVMETVNVTNLRYAFMGEDAEYTQTAATVTAEAFVARHDGWVQLANEDLDPATPVVVSVASSAKVEGTDYLVNRRMGMVKVLSTGSIADAAACTVAYAASEFEGIAIRGNVKPQIRAALMLDGVNKVDDSVGILRAWEVMLTPSGEFDWFKDDWNTIPLNGKLKTPVGYSEGFRFYQR